MKAILKNKMGGNMELVLASLFYTGFIALKKYESVDLLLIACFVPYALYKAFQFKTVKNWLPVIELMIVTLLVLITMLLMATFVKSQAILLCGVMATLLLCYRPIYIHSLHKE